MRFVYPRRTPRTRWVWRPSRRLSSYRSWKWTSTGIQLKDGLPPNCEVDALGLLVLRCKCGLRQTLAVACGEGDPQCLMCSKPLDAGKAVLRHFKVKRYADIALSLKAFI